MLGYGTVMEELRPTSQSSSEFEAGHMPLVPAVQEAKAGLLEPRV